MAAAAARDGLFPAEDGDQAKRRAEQYSSEDRLTERCGQESAPQPAVHRRCRTRTACHSWKSPMGETSAAGRFEPSQNPRVRLIPRRPVLQTQMHEDRLDHWRLQDRRNGLQIAAAAPTLLQIEQPLEQPGTAQPRPALMLSVHLARCRRCGQRGRRSLIIARRLTFGGSTRWKSISCRLGQGAGATSRCLNASGDIGKCMLPLRSGAWSFSATSPTALVCTRSSASAGGVV